MNIQTIVSTQGGYFYMADVFLTQGVVEHALALYDKVVDIWYTHVLLLSSCPTYLSVYVYVVLPGFRCMIINFYYHFQPTAPNNLTKMIDHNV
jgi:hypothetical protein